MEILELNLNVPTSGLTAFSEGKHILVKIKLVELQPPKIGVIFIENNKEKKYHILEKK